VLLDKGLKILLLEHWIGSKPSSSIYSCFCSLLILCATVALLLLLLLQLPLLLLLLLGWWW